MVENKSILPFECNMASIRVPKEGIMLLSENKTFILTERERMLVDMAYQRGFNDGYNKCKEENRNQEKN